MGSGIHYPFVHGLARDRNPDRTARAAASRTARPPVAAALDRLGPGGRRAVGVAAIDPALADTAVLRALRRGRMLGQLRRHQGQAGRRGALRGVHGARHDAGRRQRVVRRRLDVRSASFAPMDEAVALTGMEYGGITPIGLPADWPILVDAAVAARRESSSAAASAEASCSCRAARCSRCRTPR